MWLAILGVDVCIVSFFIVIIIIIFLLPSDLDSIIIIISSSSSSSIPKMLPRGQQVHTSATNVRHHLNVHVAFFGDTLVATHSWLAATYAQRFEV